MASEDNPKTGDQPPQRLDSGNSDGFFDTVVGVPAGMADDFGLHQGPKNNTGGRRRRNRHRRSRRGPSSRSSSPAQYPPASRSQSPKQHNTPNRRHYASSSKSPNRHSKSPRRHGRKSKSPKRNYAADMSVICNRVDLWDRFKFGDGEEFYDTAVDHPSPKRKIKQYQFAPNANKDKTASEVAVLRAPHIKGAKPGESEHNPLDVVDQLPNPLGKKLDKYWAQRRRLFSRFDMGIQLDEEGWYSVTPEVIADHVAERVVAAAASSNRVPKNNGGLVLMDAFCGCGGNAIAFGKRQGIGKVVCVDLDRSKLQMAAQNACLYDIPRDKLVFVECNTLFVMQHCYKNGAVIRKEQLKEQGVDIPKEVPTEDCAGFYIGGLDLLPTRIDAVFMDPPWGGVDYNALGKNGYCLEKHMKIKALRQSQLISSAPVVSDPNEGVGDDFFDSFGPPTPSMAVTVNAHPDDTFSNGVDLVRMAAHATASRLVIYDLPRNTNKAKLGQAAYKAGYRGNMKLEEHYLNGRLKTVTAYMGADYSNILQKQQHPPKEATPKQEKVDNEQPKELAHAPKQPKEPPHAPESESAVEEDIPQSP